MPLLTTKDQIFIGCSLEYPSSKASSMMLLGNQRLLCSNFSSFQNDEEIFTAIVVIYDYYCFYFLLLFYYCFMVIMIKIHIKRIIIKSLNINSLFEQQFCNTVIKTISHYEKYPTSICFDIIKK